MEDERLMLAALGSLPNVGSVTLKEVLGYYKDAQTVWAVIHRDKAIDPKIAVATRYKNALIKGVLAIDLERLAHQMERYHMSVLGITDETYPDQLKEIFNPPQVLFYRGDITALQNPRQVAMVGARNCTPYGRNVATVFASQLVRYGITIVSGGARGIDSYAHEGALKGKGSTIAVMGCGLDHCYPRCNAKLFHQIEEKGGLLLSEFGPGVAPQSGHFPMRNRIISGIAKAVVVVEAKASSGSLITADIANNEGRDVYTVPGNVLTDDFVGNHWLLSQGATLLTKAEQLPDLYNWNTKDLDISQKMGSHNGMGVLSFTLEERKILESLSNAHETSLETLAMKTNLSEGALHLSLLNLELKQCIERTASKGYIILEYGRNQFVH
ncbi:DNA-processing protein DprA [Veillonella intestinalis]|uniref:DNA-processing protein DprA n=1 Tax=Veillonella intestinalis TaxID=2941341 RepID=UPI002041297F|nr:DNA-processing protein DprA [Veillonella intestinalis]